MITTPNRYNVFKLKDLIAWFVIYFVALFVFRWLWPSLAEAIDASAVPWDEISFYAVAGGWLFYYARKSRITIREMINPQAYKLRQLTDLHLVVPLLLISITSGILIEYAFPAYFEGAPEDPVLNTWQAISGNFLVLVILAPFLEELIFRKALLTNWTVKWRAAWAVVWTSVVFGILHFDIVGGIIFGLVLAVLALKNRNQIPNIAIHGINNLIVFSLILGASGQGAESPINSSTLMVLGVMLVIAIGWVVLTLYLKKPRGWNQEETPPGQMKGPIELAN